jgi:hypothetical protein
MAESRGGTFDAELKQAYRATRRYGTYLGYMNATQVQGTLSSKEIKLKRKADNVPGLQLADVLASAVKLDVLAEFGVLPAPTGFAGEICQVLRANGKYNHQLYDGRLKGYGMVLLP